MDLIKFIWNHDLGLNPWLQVHQHPVRREMSAYARLRETDSVESLFEGGEEEANEEEILGYEKNSSDEDDDEADDDFSNGMSLSNGGSGILSFAQNTPQPLFMGQNGSVGRFPGSISRSQFFPDDDNIIVGDDYIVVGLKAHESILIHGQCKASIQRGAVLVNDIHYLGSHPTKEYEILASSSQALPLISSTQVENMELIKDTETSENKHLFTSEYKSVVKLTSMYTGLEDVGSYYIPFKNLLFNKDQEEPKDVMDHEKLFRTYSFEIILREKNCLTGMNMAPWIHDIYPLIERITGQEGYPKIIMTIGNKNTGKSTLSKLLLNSLLLVQGSQNSQVCYLDLDPGQSEFSIPYCLSLSAVSEPILGMNIPKVNDDSVTCKFFGYTSPQDSPKSYVRIIKDLINKYNTEYKPKGYHLIINTPGWIRGLGKELLIELTKFILPNHLLCLRGPSEGDQILQGLSFQEVTFFDAIYQASRYSASQLRLFNKLTYFHQNPGFRFDFLQHLLNTSPVRLLYDASSDNCGAGINGVCVLGYDLNRHFHGDDLVSMLECSIVGLHAVENETFSSVEPLEIGQTSQMPLYINNSDFSDLVSPMLTHFIGLAIIHSIDTASLCFNLYVPNKAQVARFLENGYKLVLCKGEGRVPAAEFVSPKMLRDRMRPSKRKQASKTVAVPYVNFETRNRIGGAWKVRRNIKRGTNT